MTIKIEMLRCFRAVVDTGRLSDAAEVLGRTPSAVSMMLTQFEDHIGAPLFETTRKSRLTTLGVHIYHEARRELDHFDHTLATIEGLSRSDSGHVRIAATPSVAAVILPPILQAFIAQRPNVRIELRDMSSADVQRELQRERVDIGLASLGPIAGLERRKLFSDPFGVVCRADSRLARDWAQLTWADIEGENFIANGLCDQITDPTFHPVLAASRLAVPNTASLLAMVRGGTGITVLPRLALPPDYTDLVFLPLMDTSLRREVWLVTRSRQSLTPAASAMVDAIWAANSAISLD
ncbi:LysR family transcriptional regulator [Pararhodobacter sp.]|uniref:LysR family transcriptional regulator n=1 Tax=Pararhodobacter sp. TaxID=2127056 RepID=UPI002AFF0ABA|nr:LysR substrate-binding domain-containing protein [Pararhodobacter sp.]